MDPKMNLTCGAARIYGMISCVFLACIILGLFFFDAGVILRQDNTPQRSNQTSTPPTPDTESSPPEYSVLIPATQPSPPSPTEAPSQPPPTPAPEFTIKDTGINIDLWLVMREQEIYLDLEENLERLIARRVELEPISRRSFGWEEALKEMQNRMNSERKRKFRETMGAIREGMANDA